MKEVVYIVHTTRGGKPKELKASIWNNKQSKLNIIRDGWRIATKQEIEAFYEVEEAPEPKKPKNEPKEKPKAKPEEKPIKEK